MRITTGTARGTKVMPVPGDTTRPTADKLKQAMFNAVQFEIEGRRALDLFAGTGQLGIEALSRGAEHCVFVDNSAAAVAAVKNNLERAKLAGKASVRLSDYKAYLNTAPKRHFHIIFLDPPYQPGYLKRVISFIQTFDISAQSGIILCEGDAAEPMPDELGQFALERRYIHASSAVTLYRNTLRD